MSTGYNLHPYLPTRAGKVQGAVQGATLTLFGPTGQTILIPSSEHHAGLTARQRMAMVLIAMEEHSSAPRPGARLDSSSQPKEPGDDTAMKTTCLVLLMSGIVPLIQASSASAASSNSHAAYSAQNRQQRSRTIRFRQARELARKPRPPRALPSHHNYWVVFRTWILAM